MFRPVCLLLLFSFLIPYSLLSQTSVIKPQSLRKKDKFRTQVKLMTGEEFSGKLVGVTDSTLVILLKSTNANGMANVNYSINGNSIRGLR